MNNSVTLTSTNSSFPTIAIYIGIIFIAIILIRWMFARDRSTTAPENMIGGIKTIRQEKYPINDTEFNKQFVGINRQVNFKCTYDGKEYYLANVGINQCQNKHPLPYECQQVALVLIDKDTVEKMKNKYMKQIEMNKELCMNNRKTLCKHTLPQNISNEEFDKCVNKDNFCEQHKPFITTFTILQSFKKEHPSEPTKYIVRGTDTDGNITTINQFLHNERGTNMVCGDAFPYGNSILRDDNGEVIILENNTNGKLKIKMAMNSRILNVRYENGRKIHYPDVQDGQIRVKGNYLGICKDRTCKTNDGTFHRVCLYNNIHSDRVLEFEPILL